MRTLLRLLGTPRRGDSEATGVLPFNKPSSLLFHLACRDTWVSRSELACLYRPDQPDVESLAYLRKLVFRARQYPWAPEFEMQDARLRWPVDSDVRRFRQAAAEQEWPVALELYGGTLLEGLALPDVPGFEAWLELERESLERTWCGAATAHADALEANGCLEEAGVWLQRVLERDPLDEGCLQAYVRVLHADGRRHRALEAYEAFRARLAEELEVVPLEATQALVDGVRRDAGPRAPAVASTRAVAAASPREGAGGGSSAQVTRLTTPLPAPTTSFVGRERELDALAERLARPDCRLLTIHGLGGIGKTRLALELARREAARFEDGVRFVTMAAAPGARSLASEVAAALPVAPAGSRDAKQQLIEALRGRSMLLVLDNLEGVLEETPFLTEVLEGAPGVRVVATSRVALELQGEWLYDLAGLAFPDEGTGASLEDSDAVRLFVERAERIAPSFVPTEGTLRAVAAICRKVEGMPLAIELVAGWSRSLSAEQMLAELERNASLLATRLRDVPERQRSLRKVFEGSWATLSPAERKGLAKLSVFEGGFTLEAAEEVAGTELSLLVGLINRSLVRRGEDGRFGMHAMIRAFARDALAESPEDAQRLLDAHAAYYCTLLREIRGFPAREQTDAVKRVDAVLENVEAAWRHAGERRHLEWIRDAADSLAEFYYVRGRYGEGERSFGWMLARLDVAPDGDRLWEVRSGLERARGIFLFQMNRIVDARRCFERVLELPAAASPARDAAESYRHLGAICYKQGEYDRAEGHLEQALRLHEELGDLRGVAFSHNVLGLLAKAREEFPRAAEHFETCAGVFGSLGDERGRGVALGNLGSLAEAQGDLARAERLYGECLLVFTAMDFKGGVATMKTNLGVVAWKLGRLEEAKTMTLASLEIKRELQDGRGIAISLINLAEIHALLGEGDLSHEAFLQALRLLRAEGLQPLWVDALVGLASLHALEGRDAQANRIVRTVLAHAAVPTDMRQRAERIAGRITCAGSCEESPPSLERLVGELLVTNALSASR